ncbi:hypothetical protein GE061_005475 [Apolygus lucorum]|nr:hypothetical protein GE061_007419 [Apolygus lucorum]KAF6201028.1 hypothetical protein GE061_005475 [Apolygus lucorum]
MTDDPTEGLTEEQLIELIDQDEHAELDEEEPKKKMNLQTVNNLLSNLEEAINIAIDEDPDLDRAVQFRDQIRLASLQYRDLQTTLTVGAQQKRITSYFSKIN